MDFTQSLSDWAKDKPLSILQLDPADRAVLKIADERDAIQKKTFTKWLNKHLKKHWRYLEVNHHVEDLFEDLRDGNNLISLLEVLSGELLSRERGRMRFHQLQNVQMALEFLRNRNIRLVNIRPEDIVDGNPKLTLGLIWTIILHFQISDIITGMEDETVTAREALLRWAQRTTERYPGVKVTDFTKSWRDGLAFNAILHRNRPDLLDFKSLRARNAKDNLETAFSLAEKEFGITRLLDVEDVDTPEPDERSLITYIASLYDVFPDPPTHHPFADDDKNRKTEEYKDLAKSLLLWMKESRTTFVNQKLFNNLIDMKNLLLESAKFRSNELPKRLRDKQRLSHLYKDIEKSSQHSIDDFPKDIRIEELEKAWDQTNLALQDRDQKIKDEICRLEKLQRLAEKFTRESKLCAGKIEDIEKRIFEEEKRLHRLRPDDLKHNCDQIKNDLKFIDETLKGLHKDLLVFQDKNYSQTAELKFRLDSLNERYKHLKEVFQSGLIPLTEQSEKVIIEKKITKTKTLSNEKVSETNKLTSSQKEHFDWIDKKHKRIQSLEFGIDYQTIKGNLDQIKMEQKTIEQYKKKIGSFNPQKNGKDTESLSDDLETLQDKFNALVTFTSQKQQEFENLLDFVQSATRELKWMSDKEETEIARDWSAKNLNLNNLEHHQETLTSDLEKREIQFNAVQSRGESLLLQKHPASECIGEYLSKMQKQWSWLLQLTFCLEIHLRHAQVYHKFFKEARESEQWMKKTEEKLNTTFNKTAFSIDEGETYIKQMETLKDDLTKYNDTISSFVNRSSEVVPLKQRRLQPSKPLPIMAICNYKSSEVNISKGDKYVLKEISHRTWKVMINNSKESVIPSVCFVIPPPNTEATELAQSLKKRYDDLLALWTQRQRKLRQNLIFSTIKVVKSWDLTHLRSLDVAQRESILKALNSDALKLIKEGTDSEPALMKLKQEMEQCNLLFDTLVKKISETESEKSPKSVERKLSDTIFGLQTTLNEKEKFLKSKLQAPIVWDFDLLENSVMEHKDFDIELRGFEDQINEVVQAFKNVNKKTTALQMKYDTLVQTWDKIWKNSNLYIEKLKTVEVGLHHLNEATQAVSSIEVKLASCNNLSSNLEDLQGVHDDLLLFQEDMQKSQNIIDEAQESSRKLKELMQRIRTKQTNNPDVNKFENDLKKLLVRWDSAKSQIVERLRSCGASYELLRTYKNKVEKDNLWISETTVKLNSLKTVKKMTTKEIEMTVEPSMNLYSSISEKNSSFEETNTLGARYIREAKVAVQENFKVCQDNTSQLNLWMKDVEEKLTDLGVIQGHLPSLQLQISTVKVLKDELESKQNLITTCLDQMRNLAQRGLEVLSKEEVNYLQKNLISLRTRYDSLLNECNRFLKRLASAFEELQKYKSEVKTLKDWMIEVQQEFKKIQSGLGDLNALEKKSEHIRTFTSDVIAHQADLRFVTMAAQKFIDESQEYLKTLNTFRTNLPNKLPALKATESEIKSEVQEITTIIHSFLNEVNKLSDNYASICSKYRSYNETVEKATIWISEVKKSSKKVIEEPVADEPSAVQDQLNKAKLINMEVVGQSRLVENIFQAVKLFTDTLENCNVAPKDTKNIESTINSIQDDYSELHDKIACRIKELQIALIHSQDIQGGLDRFLKWLEETETKSLKFQNQPISLIIEKLECQVQEYKILKSDISNQKQSIEMLKSTAKEISTEANPKLAKKVDSKLKDISQRFDKISEKVFKRCQLLEEISESVHAFEEIVKQFDEWCASALERIESTDDVHRNDIDGFSSVIEYILNQRDSKKEDFDQLLKVGKSLKDLKDVSDLNMVKDKIHCAEQQWKNLGDVLMEKRQLIKSRSEQIAAYDSSRIKVLDWLLKIERDFEKLEPLAIDQHILKKQAAETTHLLKEHSDYSSTIEKLNHLGNSCENLVRTHTSNGKAASPTRKASSPSRKSPSKSKSNENFSTSPVKSQTSLSSPLSKVSSGFSSRSSTDTIGDLDDLTPVQHQLLEINDRYSLLRSKISDRSNEITSITEETRSFYSIIKILHTYIEAKQKQLSKEGTSFSKDVIDNKFKFLKEIEKEMLEKQSEIDNLKANVPCILSKRKGAKGTTELHEELQTVVKQWSSLSTTIQENLTFLQNLKEYQDLQQLMKNWLAQKEKMFQVLGPIASEPRMVFSQVQQIQVMRDEFTSQNSFMVRLNDVSKSIIHYLQSTGSSSVKITEQIEVIQQQWNDMSHRLIEREKSLETASGVAKDFQKNLNELKDNLQKISEKFESYEEKGIDIAILLKKLMEMEDELDKLRPLLADAFSVCEQLCDVISDSSSKTEIKYRVSILEKSYTTLRKKIENKKAEVESSLKEDKVFFKVCEDIQSWLSATEFTFSRSGKISGNISKLLKEIEEYELFYKQIMSKEHEVYLCLSKGSDMLSKSTSKQEIASMKGKLDSIKKQFEKIKKIAIDRHTTLRSCLENCKKYQTAIDTFIPWLEEKERHFQTLKLESLKRDLLNKQIKEVQLIKSELFVHHQVFQNIQQYGDAIISNCECDTETTKKQLDELKGKWNRLNTGVVTKVQFLEDLSQVLMEYDERFRDVQHGVQRLEDKMCSHDACDVSCDPVVLDRLKVLLQEVTSMKDEINKLKKFSKVVIEKAGKDINSSEILKNLEVIESRHHSLKTSLEERYSSFSSSYKVISVFKEQIKTLRSELSSLDECFDQIRPIARDLKILKDQLNETKELKSNVLQSKKKYLTSKKLYEDMTKQDHTVDTKIYMEQINNMSRQISRLEEHINEREITIQTMITRIGNFYSMYSDTEKKVKSLLKKEEAFDAVIGDVETIRNQQQKFKNLHSNEVLPLGKQIVEVNKIGHGLVQSVTNGVDTTDIEQRIEELNSTWNSLQESINEKEKKLDVALLQSGKLQEALSGVQKWLIDTEEMVASQKPPSFDFKVVKAQVEEQKFLKKMLLDRQSSVIALKTMETEMVSTTKTTELEQAEKLMKSITSRFHELISTSENRMTTLESIVPVAQEFQNIYTPFTEWIETVEKRLHSMSAIPVEESRIEYMIAEQKKVSTDIAAHGTSLKHLNDISEKLKQNTDSTESKSLQQKIKSVNKKFTEVKSCCDNTGSLLHEAQKGIGSFTTSYTKVLSFVEETSLQLTRFQVLSVYSEKLQSQLRDLQNLKEKLNTERQNIEKVVESGEKIMKFASGEDSIQMKEKLDILNVKLTEASNKLNERLKTVEMSLPLVESFYSSFTKLTSWMDSLENSLKIFDSSALDIQRENIKKMEEGIFQHRSTMDSINHNGSRLCQLSSGEGAIVIENQMSQANQKFEKICEQVRRKAEQIELSLQRKFDVINDIDELSDWFQEIEKQVTEAGGLTSEPNSLTVLLKEQKSLCEELNGQKTRVRDVIASAKRLMRESSSEDLSFIHEKMEQLKLHSSNVSTLCQERLSTLEHALSLAQHFFETHTDLGQWLDEAEGEAELLESPALNSVQIRKQQGRNKDLTDSVQEHKPLVDKLNKTGSALTKLCKEEESNRLEVILESDNSRYNALRKILREHQNALEEALQATSQFSDKLEGILNALTSTADQLHNAEPISAHPERIQEQINDNKAVLQDLDKRTITLEAVKKAADDVITKASTIDEPAVKDIKMKLDRLNDLWVTIQTAAHNRGKSLEEALVAAERFWDELTSVMKALKELQSNLNHQEPPAVEPTVVHQQQEVLLDIKQEITQTKPEVDHCRQAGQNLMQLCGEPDKPDVQKHIEDLDSVWENVTTLYAKREQNLVDAMEKAMVFHDTLQNLLEFLDTSEDKFGKFGEVSSDIDSIKEQMNQLKNFKIEVDPHMIEVEALNRQAQELMERTTSDQSVSIREPLIEINRRWDDLLKCIVDRQREMENTLLKLGQFQHTLEEHLIWMSKTEKSLDELKPVYGDPQVIEIVLAKHKVISNDIQAHQSSIDAINRAGHEFLSSDRTSEDAKSTYNKLQNLQVRWQQLQDKSAEQYRELELALKEAQQFHQDIQDLLLWLNETDGHLVTTKPVGGLPETAKEQLNKFMDLYNELDTNRYKVEDILQQGQNYLKKSGESSAKTLQHSLRTLKQKWDSVLNKASDRKIKLEIALREAMEFHEALQTFVGWLTNAEKYLTGLKPVSRHMKHVLEQIEEHRVFQKDLGVHREVMLNLDKKGTHLKYFSQKQDVILIKNLLISVQHRWEKVVSKAAERTRALDHGYKESKEFHDAYGALSLWLDEAEKILDATTPIGNDPPKIKKMLSKHKEFQRTLGSKQVTYDSTMKIGRILKDRCPKQDVQLLQNMMDELKTRWNKICSKSVNRQRNLEEALLYSGQFKEAVLALMDWFDKTIKSLSEIKPYHGDLDTVTSLIEQHKGFEEELKNRGLSLESVCKTSDDLKKQASPSDVEVISAQVEELNRKWKTINDLSEKKKADLSQALQLAEKLYKMVHILLEWLSDAEMKLRFFGSLPEDEESTKNQIADHENFMKEMEDKENLKNSTLELAHDIIKKCHPDGLSVIRHWITILQSRWDEVSTWAKQRDQRLRDHLLSLKDINDLLEELLAWLNNAESSLTALEAEPLPDDVVVLDNLIKEHQIFMTDMSKRQSDVDRISRAFSSKRQQSKGAMSSQIKEKSKDKVPRSVTPALVKTSTPIRPQNESDIKHPRARLLLEKWRTVWLLAMERQRRLQDRRNYLLELDRIKHFDFNEWRKRYLSWLNNKKSRIMDQFKKIDKNNVGKVTKQEFIDGILRSKFATSLLEMERVADIFDRNGDGFIDSKEYIDTLRPEKESEPVTDAEKIQDEVQRQVAKCTCVHRFKVYQVGEGKYRFGDSQKLRLVRILRSTVMVRVGGGWVALDEFLVKNDPCRAKGRTNLELREQFILADGVSQSMTPFKPKPSPNSSVSSQGGAPYSIPSAGPITKIREKSERSTPMRQSCSSVENSSEVSGPSFSETDSFNKSGNMRVTPPSSRLSSRNSRPNSRQGNQSSSRVPSDFSQDGIDKQFIAGNGKTSKIYNSRTKSPHPEASKIPSIKKTVKQP